MAGQMGFEPTTSPLTTERADRATLQPRELALLVAKSETCYDAHAIDDDVAAPSIGSRSLSIDDVHNKSP